MDSRYLELRRALVLVAMFGESWKAGWRPHEPQPFLLGYSYGYLDAENYYG